MAQGRKTGGRKKGTRNRATVERMLHAERAAAAIQALTDGHGEVRPLAKDELSAMVSVVKTIVARLQDAAEEVAPDKPASRHLLEWFRFYLEACKSAAEYESPKVRPIDLSTGAAAAKEAGEAGERELRIVVEGGLPEPDAMVEQDSEDAIQAEIDALRALKEEARRRREARGDGQA